MASVTRWLLHKFTDINRGRMNEHIEVMCKESGKSKLYVKCALMVSFLTRGTGYTDFFRGNYIGITKAERDTFVTAKSFYKIHEYLNNPAYTSVIEDKLIFNRIFKEYLGREYLNLRIAEKEDFKAFLKDKEVVFAKDPEGYGGHGVTKLTVSEIKDFDALYDALKKNNQVLIEEAIVQCKELNEINPNVVNSFRVVTLYKDGETYLLNNALRVNQDSTSVIGCTNDLYFSLGADGKINSNVIDDLGNIYLTHPLTGKNFSDVCIPGVDKAFKMCLSAAKLVPQVRYIGWDIAFTVNGPVFVEGNEYPGYGLFQHYKLKNSRTGHKKEIADILGDEMKNIK